jgi:hypothetical protein
MRTNDLKAGHEPDCQRRTWIMLPVKATKKPATLIFENGRLFVPVLAGAQGYEKSPSDHRPERL